MADRIVQLKDKAGNKIFPVGTGLADGSVTTAKLAEHSVTGTYNVGFDGKIALDTIGAANLANNAVIAEKIANGAVTSNKISNGSVKSEKIDWGSTINWQESNESYVSDNVTFWVGAQYIKMANGLMIVYGVDQGAQVSAQGTVDRNINLSTHFLRTPVVMVGFTSDSTSYKFGGLTCSNNYSTASQIRLRVFNNTDTPRFPMISFIAIGRWK